MAAEKLNYTTKIQGQKNPLPANKKLTFSEVNEIKDKFNTNADLIDSNAAQFDNLKEQKVTADIEVHDVAAAATYEFDTSLYRLFITTLLGDATLRVPQVPARGKNVIFTVILTGDFSPTIEGVISEASGVLSYGPMNSVKGDDYDGTIRNRLVFSSYRLADDTQVNDLTIENL